MVEAPAQARPVTMDVYSDLTYPADASTTTHWTRDELDKSRAYTELAAQLSVPLKGSVERRAALVASCPKDRLALDREKLSKVLALSDSRRVVAKGWARKISKCGGK